jgi:2,3-bisphosphoglycerate-independent phosphoglycerate mutase
MKNKTKYVILIGDGMGDYPLQELNGLTPLEKANTPTLDTISAKGELSLVKTVPDGYPPGSDVANLSLLGYDPQKYYTGRAPLEAASMGIELGADEIAYRCNLVTIESTNNDKVTMLDYSAEHITTAEAKVLIEALDDKLSNARIRFYPGVSYRHLMVLKGDAPAIQTVPPHDYTGQDVSVHWQTYQNTFLADIMSHAHAILKGHTVNAVRKEKGLRPANSIWLWGEGKSPSMPTLKSLYNVTGGLISAVDLLKGIGVYAGLEIINVAGATGYLDTNYAGKAEAALQVLEKQDFVLVHVEAPDEASHHGLIKDKIQAIEDFDQKIVKPIWEGLAGKNDHFRLVVAMDHFTPISIQTHTNNPVPVAIYDSENNNSGCGLAYNEKNAQKTGITYETGELFLKKVLEKM